MRWWAGTLTVSAVPRGTSIILGAAPGTLGDESGSLQEALSTFSLQATSLGRSAGPPLAPRDKARDDEALEEGLRKPNSGRDTPRSELGRGFETTERRRRACVSPIRGGILRDPNSGEVLRRRSAGGGPA